MNKEQEQIIDEVYNNYWEETFRSQGTEWVESLSGMSLGKEIVKIHTDKDGKVYRLTYNGHGELISVKHLY